MDNYKLSVLTVSRNKENIERVIANLADSKNIEIPKVELIVSWNGGEDYLDIDTEAFSTVHFFVNKPYNFAKNNNAIAENASGNYLLFLNDDVILDPYSLANALSLIQSKAVGIVGANLRYQNGFLQHAGVFFDESTHMPYHRLKGKVAWDAPSVVEEKIVPAVTGAFLLMRKEEFLSIKFDERFKVAGEDIVLNCTYAQKYNRKIIYSYKVSGVHIENDTRKRTGDTLTPESDLELIKHAVKNVHSIKKTKVRIVTEKPGWILHRKAEEIKKKAASLEVVINEDMHDADIHYYINYGFFNKRPENGLVVGNFTHYDKDGLGNKFKDFANIMDHCFSVSAKTTEHLVKFGIEPEKITTILVGADKKFVPKLTLGLVGRPYKGGRKGEAIIEALRINISLMEKINIVSMNDAWGVTKVECEDNAIFYNMIDYLLVPSLIEGGPVPFMEALACGTLSISPPIGVVPEFSHIEYETGDVESLTRVLESLANEYIDKQRFFANEMEMIDWTNWAFKHEIKFHELVLESKKQFIVNVQET